MVDSLWFVVGGKYLTPVQRFSEKLTFILKKIPVSFGHILPRSPIPEIFSD